MPPYQPNTVNQTVQYNGVTYRGQPGQGWTVISGSPASSSSGSSDPLALAQAAQQLQVQANQPAIQTLQTQYNPDTGTGSLVDKYKALLDSITASEQPALNSVITATNNELGKRGITGDSTLGQQQIAEAQAPVSTSFGQTLAQTGLSEQQDLGGLAAQIASLRAGNVGNGLTFASGITGSQNSLAAAQAAAAAQVQAAQAQPYTPLSSGQALGNRSTGQISLPSFLNNN